MFDAVQITFCKLYKLDVCFMLIYRSTSWKISNCVRISNWYVTVCFAGVRKFHLSDIKLRCQCRSWGLVLSSSKTLKCNNKDLRLQKLAKSFQLRTISVIICDSALTVRCICSTFHLSYLHGPLVVRGSVAYLGYGRHGPWHGRHFDGGAKIAWQKSKFVTCSFFNLYFAPHTAINCTTASIQRPF